MAGIERLGVVGGGLMGSGITEVVARAGLHVVTVEVSDDGTGGADLEPGGGLQGLADRLSALGARLEVVSPPGGGTTVRTVLVCR